MIKVLHFEGLVESRIYMKILVGVLMHVVERHRRTSSKRNDYLVKVNITELSRLRDVDMHR
jgi:hypothetical protein